MSKLRIVLIYSVLGPLVGGMLMSIIVAGYFAILESPKPGESALDWAAGFLELTPFVAFSSYYLGGVQAFLTGTVIAANSDREGRFGYRTAAVASARVGVAAMAFIVIVYSANGVDLSLAYYALLPVVLGVIGIAASLVLRLVFQKFFRPRTATR